MASPAQIVRQYLIDKGIVIDPEEPGELYTYNAIPGDGVTPCYVSSLPDDIDQAIVIKDQAGVYFGRRMPDGKSMLHPGIQFVIRSLDYQTGYDLANSIVLAFEAVNNTNTTVNTVVYSVKSVYRTSTIIALGEEVGKKRQLFSINARVAFNDSVPSIG